MKKITFLTLITLCFNFSGSAQPVLNAADFVEGTSVVGHYLDAPTFDPGSAGENQTWNFSALPNNAYDFQLTTVPFATSPFTANYPEGNFSFKQQYSTSLIYSYYKLSNTAIELVGHVEDATPMDYYPDFQTLFTFPFTYGTVINDTYQKVISGSLQYQQITYDAYGTLILPSGTYSNVMRKKVASSESGSFNYMWFLGNPFRILLVGAVGSHENVIVYQTAILNTPQSNADKAVAFYPNPVENILNIKSDATIASAIVYDGLGRIVIRKEINESIDNLDFASLHSGLYLIKIFGKENNLIHSEKIIKK